MLEALNRSKWIRSVSKHKPIGKIYESKLVAVLFRNYNNDLAQKLFYNLTPWRYFAFRVLTISRLERSERGETKIHKIQKFRMDPEFGRLSTFVYSNAK